MKTLTAAILLAMPLLAAPHGPIQTDTPEPKVTVTAQGHDVRMILTNIFSQAKKSVIVQPSIQFSLFLSLQDTDFTKALDLICGQAGLAYEVRDGIYHVHKKKVFAMPAAANPDYLPPVTRAEPKLTVNDPIPDGFVARPSQLPPGRLPVSVLKRKITTRLSKTDIREVLDALASQAKIKIELDPTVPAYKMDIYLHDTSLKYALDQVTHAAKLTYTFTDHQSIRLALKEDPNTNLLP